MESYETVMILNPTLDEKDRDKFIADISKLFVSHSDKPVHMSKWGERKLAYPIKGHKEGYYVHFYHRDTESGAKTIEETLDTLTYYIIKFVMVQNNDDDFDWDCPTEGYVTLPETGLPSKVNKYKQPDAYDVLLGLAKY